MTGPVQVVVLGIDHPVFTGEVLAELTRLRDAAVVRLVDVLLVSRVDDERFETVPPPGPLPADAGQLAAALLGLPATEAHGAAGSGVAEESTSSTWSLADSVPVGSTAAVALIEHLWAAPLRDAIQRAGGVPLDETWLAPRDVQLLDALIAQREP